MRTFAAASTLAQSTSCIESCDSLPRDSDHACVHVKAAQEQHEIRKSRMMAFSGPLCESALFSPKPTERMRGGAVIGLCSLPPSIIFPAWSTTHAQNVDAILPWLFSFDDPTGSVTTSGALGTGAAWQN